MFSELEKLINDVVDRASSKRAAYTPRPVQPVYGQQQYRPAQQPVYGQQNTRPVQQVRPARPVQQAQPAYRPKPEFRPVPEYFKEDDDNAAPAKPAANTAAKAVKPAVKPIVAAEKPAVVIDPKQAAQAVVWTEILGQRRGITLRENRRRRMSAMIPPQSDE